MQNFEKILFKISSVVTAPVISPSLSRAARISTATSSPLIPLFSDCKESSRLDAACVNALWCRMFVTVTLFPSSGDFFDKTVPTIFFFSSSIPSPVCADTLTIGIPLLKRISSRAFMFSLSGRSILLMTISPRLEPLFSQSPLNLSISSFSACLELSKTKSRRSLFSICDSVRRTPSCSIGSFVSLIPAVSTILKSKPSILRDSSIVSRVVPGISVTMARFEFNKLLRILDLPTFGEPMSTTFTPSR